MDALALTSARTAARLLLALIGATWAPSVVQEGRAEPGAHAQAPSLPRDLARAEDVTGSELAFVELETPRDTYLVGEPFSLRLRFGIERERIRGLVQLFQRPLDVPVQVFAPALELLEGARFLDDGDPPAGASFALDERITRAARAADAERAGHTYAVFEYERRIAATRPGELVVAAPILGFAHATSFGEDFVSGTVPLDKRDALVRGRDLRLTILPPPEAGQPPEFTGAIGAFRIRAAAEPRELDEGQSLKLTLVIEGQGDLSRCEPPRLSDLDGFHLQGNLVERGATQLSVIYDLAPRDARVRAIPPIRFAYFDTTPPAGYRTIETEPIGLTVRPRGERSSAEDRSQPGPGPSSPGTTWWIAALVLVALALAAARLRRTRRG